MKKRIDSSYVSTSRLRDDPNYPGVPVSDDLASKVTSRATVTYEVYVLQYGARQRGNALLTVIGFFAAVVGGLLLGETGQILAILLGVGITMAGVVGFLITADAHASYTRDLAVSVSETYNRRPAPPPATVRPFVASGNGDGRTTNTGRLTFEPRIWQALFDRALANGGAITRDTVAKPAGVGPEWYHADGYNRLLEELTRLGFIDGRKRLTPAALQWYAQQIALPLDAMPLRTTHERTNGGTNGANGGDSEEWGGLE